VRTLFLLFANSNCFPMSDGKLVALLEFRRFFSITDVSNRKLRVCPPPPPFLKGWRITDRCNNAKVTTAVLSISVKYLCRNSKHRADFSRYLKRFMIESRLLPSSQISGRMNNTVVSIKCTCDVKNASQPDTMPFFANNC
jgi:hypothetical protein